MGAFDQAGIFGQHEFAAIDGGNAKVRMQRRERIDSDLRPRAGDRCKEGGLAGIRQTDETGIRNQLQTQPDGLFNAGKTGLAQSGADWWRT